MSPSDAPAAIFRKMNAINKTGRPIIPSQSGDGSFFIGSRAREEGWVASGGWREGKRRRSKRGGKREDEGVETETRSGRERGQFVIKFKIPSAEEPMKE